MKKIKITKEYQPCRKCKTPVIRVKSTSKPKPNQAYRFKSYLKCPKCGTMYMQESEKVYLKKEK